MRGGTLFSGIGAPECAMPWIDWRWCAEIDPFASAVHAARFPGIPNFGDVNRIDPDAIEPVDLVVFGSPCQDFSVAGKRRGMDGERGNLSLVALALVAKLRPRWLVFENVPGLLSNWSGDAPGDLAEGAEREDDQYSDFAAFLGAVRECGYLGCWRVHDAQFAGVPQRRRRVFFVGCLGDWRSPAAVLFEPESLRGDPPPRREAGQNAPTIPARSTAGGGLGTDFDCDGGLIAFSAKDHGADHGDLAPTLRAGGHDRSHANAGVMPAIAFAQNSRSEVREMPYAGVICAEPGSQQQTYIAHSLRADGFDAGEDGTVRGTPLVAVPIQSVQAVREKRQNGIGIGQDGDPMFTQTGRDQHAVMTLAIRGRGDSHDLEWRDDGTANAVLTPNGGRAGIGVGAIAQPMSVRRLTPVECERLQGLPDGWTDIPYRGKPAADGPRYRAIGNSMAVPVVRWIGQRIRQFEDAQSLAEAAD